MRNCFERCNIITVPKRSCGKVMFFTRDCQEFCPKGGGVNPPGQTPPVDTPPNQSATTADGTHPTGMHSCFNLQVLRTCGPCLVDGIDHQSFAFGSLRLF